MSIATWKAIRAISTSVSSISSQTLPLISRPDPESSKVSPAQTPAFRLPPLPSIRDLLKLYKLKAIKQLSQNFILDDKLTGKIVKATGNLNSCYVCEVGPGPCGITRSILLKNPKKILLIEKDRRFESVLRLLKSACPPNTIDIYWGDVMSFEMSRMFPDETKRSWEDGIPPIHVIGNLPFSISTPLIIRWLKAMSEKKNVWVYGRVPLTLTFQLEVVQRIVADTSDEQRSRLSIMAQHLCHCFHKFTIPGSAFVPKPDVDVGVVKFIPRIEPLIKQDFNVIEKVVRHAFSMRQKYCYRPISTLFPKMVRNWFADELFIKTNIDPQKRSFELSMEEFKCLVDAYVEIIEQYPSLSDYNYRGFKPDEFWKSLYGHLFESFTKEKSSFTVTVDTDAADTRNEDPDEYAMDEDGDEISRDDKSFR